MAGKRERVATELASRRDDLERRPTEELLAALRPLGPVAPEINLSLGGRSLIRQILAARGVPASDMGV